MGDKERLAERQMERDADWKAWKDASAQAERKPRCRSCDYWAVSNGSAGTSGQCRVNGPSPGLDAWPDTRAEDWCALHSEWQKDQEDLTSNG